jgi:hypothetical protein
MLFCKLYKIEEIKFLSVLYIAKAKRQVKCTFLPYWCIARVPKQGCNRNPFKRVLQTFKEKASTVIEPELANNLEFKFEVVCRVFMSLYFWIH